MIGILKKYLDYIGVKDFMSLRGDELDTYNTWQEVLSKEVTVINLREFAELQIAELQKDLKKHVKEGNDRDALFTTARLENYEAMVDFIDEPDRSKNSLKEHINNLLSSN